MLAALRAQKQGRSFPQLQQRLQREPAKFELFAFFTEFPHPHLASCVERVVAVFNDPGEYARMVREPPFANMACVCNASNHLTLIHFHTGAHIFHVLHDQFGTPPRGASHALEHAAARQRRRTARKQSSCPDAAAHRDTGARRR